MTDEINDYASAYTDAQRAMKNLATWLPAKNWNEVLCYASDLKDEAERLIAIAENELFKQAA